MPRHIRRFREPVTAQPFVDSFARSFEAEQLGRRRQAEKDEERQFRREEDATRISDETMLENRRIKDKLRLEDNLREITEDTVVPEGAETFNLSVGQFYRPVPPSADESIRRFLAQGDPAGGDGIGRKDFKISGKTAEGLAFSFDPVAKAEETRAEKKFTTKQTAVFKQAKVAKEIHLANVDDSLRTLDEIEKGMEFFGFSGLQPTSTIIPGLQSKKREWAKNFDRFKAELVLDVMSELKRASKTGATGFGQLNRAELQLLINATTALDKATDPVNAKKHIDLIREKLMKVRSTIEFDDEDLGGDLGGQDEDAQAIEWAQQNPNDPRAIEIMRLHGGR